MKHSSLKLALKIIALCPLFLCQLGHTEELQRLLTLSLEELVNVTITSPKREEKAQQVAMAVTVLDANQLETWHIDEVMRLGLFVPGLVMGRTGYDPRPAMRGVRTQQVEFNDTAVSIYQDGIYRSRHAQAMMPFLDVERVEIIRGPQGTLFGRNSYGGAIDVLTKDAEFGRSYGMAEIELGDHNSRNFKFISNIAASDSLAMRFSGLRHVRDPLIENTYDETAGLKDKNTYLGRVKINYQVNEEFSLSFKYERWREESNGNGLFGHKVIGVPYDFENEQANPFAPIVPRIGRDDICESACGRIGAGRDVRATVGFDSAATPLEDPFSIRSDFTPIQNIGETQLAATAQYETPSTTIKLLASSTDFQDLRMEDGDFSPFNSVAEGYYMGLKGNTLELHAASTNRDTWGWVAGVFLLDEYQEYAFLWKDISTLSFNQPDSSAALRDEWASWMSLLEINTFSSAFYGEINFDLLNGWRGIVGARMTSDRRDWDILAQDNNDLSTINFIDPIVQDSMEEWRSLTWKFGLEKALHDNSFVYSTIANGFVAGNLKNGEQSYDEQAVIAFEVGSKNIFWDGKLRLNLSVYHNRYKELLSTSFDDFEGTTFGVVDNSGNIESQGLEIEADWLASQEVIVSLRSELSNANYRDFYVSNPYPNGGETINGVENIFNLKGEQVALSPDFSVTFAIQHTRELYSGKFQSALALQYISSFRASDEPYPYGEQNAFTTIDLNLKWDSANERIILKFFAENLTNEAIVIRANRFGGNVAVQEFADPKTFGFGIGYRF